MPHFLVSGIAELVSDVAAALRENGATVVEVDDLADVPKACEEAGPGAFDGYVQLPASFDVQGGSVVQRVHHFFADGVLARFPAVSAALPCLTPDARLTFVLGVLPPEVSTDDDVAARAALVRILGHASRADGPEGLRVSVLESGTSAEEIAQTASGRRPASGHRADGYAGDSYADWRVEILGLMSVEG
jgi:hypothetical protein